MNEVKYKSDNTGKCAVYVNKQVIAVSVLGKKGYEVVILQGMDRKETIKKICNDCPEFAKANNINENYYPQLMSKQYAKKYQTNNPI